MSIPNLSTLYERIHKGSEGGLEFARLLNLLLIAESSIQNFQFIASSDASGDYKGVDGIIIRKNEKIGVQYKFYPIPLSSNHKTAIKQSLETALKKFPEMNKWILIIPHNPDKFTLEFLDGLSEKNNINIECWGHLHILELILKHPQIGHKYYSQLELIYTTQSLTDEQALFYFNQFVNPNSDVDSLFFQAQPNVADCKTIFTSKYYKEICDVYYHVYRDSMENSNESSRITGKNRVSLESYTLTDIRNSSDNLPGGMATLFQQYDALQPGIKFYKINLLKDEDEQGMSYSVWCYINGRWVFFFKPWRIIREIDELSKRQKN